jgi:hypothetical protein
MYMDFCSKRERIEIKGIISETDEVTGIPGILRGNNV